MKNKTPGRNYFAVQVKTKMEEKFIQMVNMQNPGIPMRLYFPQRHLDIRKGGKIMPSKLAIFPGYVFLELDEDEDIEQYVRTFRSTGRFFRFLKSNNDILPLQNRDLELILHFIKTVGPVAGKSKVYFDENSRIVVLAGPLSGLEGKIVKVDRRKRRAKVKLDLYNDFFFIDLSFEVIEKARE